MTVARKLMLVDLFLGQNALFYSALLLTVALCVLEVILLLIGFSSSDSAGLDGLDGDGDVNGSGGGILGYLNVGRLPFTLFFATACAVFGLTGLAIQQASFAVTGQVLPMAVAAPLALLGSVPGTRWISRLLGRLMPKTETTALSQHDLVGLTAIVTLGVAKRGSPAQARVRDQFGQNHYVMVEPARAEEALSEGQAVLLTQRAGHHYYATAATPLLTQ
ncbi:OB-fold-containig protein [Aquidulcibacter sp.]|uniref:OB-fold-containig protein n=1 Tax=Aquidulcibacter sp. TaxID=2052990 RepID=UPI003BA43955